MPATYEPIASVTTTDTSLNTIAFTSIPQTYTDLVLVVTGGYTFLDAVLGVRFNNDSSNLYSNTGLAALTGASTYRETGQNTMYIGWYPYVGSGFDSSTNTGNMVVDINNYTSSLTLKNVLARNSIPGANGGTREMVGLWRSTAAITRIDCTLTTYNNPYYATGTQFTLYGIKAA